jgi:TolB-like protein/DNA-binding SARP family transcriptional activator
MPGFRLKLLGGFELRSASGAAIALAARKPALLLAYLALRPAQPHGREALAGLFWGDSDEVQARNSLRQALAVLRQHLRSGDGVLVTPEAETVAVVGDALTTDVAELERALKLGTREALEQAVALCDGELLEGYRPHEPLLAEWLTTERRHRREQALAAMTRLLDLVLAEGANEAGIGLALRILALDPLQESAHRALMRLYARQGRRGAALTQYQACREILERELGVAPEPETQRLHKELREQRGVGDPAVPSRRPHADPATPPTTQRRLAAILAMDVVGYSRLMERDEAGTVARYKALRRAVVDPMLATHGGRIVDLKGDGAMVEFHSVVAAVEAAIAIQRATAAHDARRSEADRIRFRIGITSGDVIVHGEEIFGDRLNIAGRIQSLCEPGGVWLSGGVHNQIRGMLAVKCEPTGRHQVKNISEPIETWRVRLGAGEPAPAHGAGPTPTEAPHAHRPSIAVLPFDNLSDDAEQGYLADGLAEDIITELAHNNRLIVMARETSFSFRGQRKRIEEIGAELRVGYVLEGSVRRVGDSLRLTAQLIDGATGAHVWAERFDVAARELVATLDEIVRRIAATLFSEIRHTEKAAALRSSPDSFDVYTLALKGLALKHQHTGQSYREGRRVLQRAIQLAPGYAPAHAYLGCLDAADCAAGYSGDKRPEEIDAAILLIRRALQLDPTMAYAHQVLGFALSVAGRPQEALAAVEEAVALSPGDAHTLMLYGRELATNGRFGEALSASGKAFALNPKAPIFYHAMHARSLYGARGHAAVLAATAPCLERNSGHRACRPLRAAALAELDRLPEARAEIRDLLVRANAFTLRHAEIYTGYAGDPATNTRLLERLREAGLPASGNGGS